MRIRSPEQSVTPPCETPNVFITKRIVCLANSRKLNGRCIAGIELVDGASAEWVRPVSNREHQEVSEYERQYNDGSDPRVLDVIDVPLLEPRPGTYQRENWLLDANYYWTRIGTVGWEGLAALARSHGPLWINGRNTYYGLNDEIVETQADLLSSSLALVHVGKLRLRVFAPGTAFGNSKRRVQAAFEHAGVSYRLWVTDPVYELRYLAHADGIHELRECYLTVSLGEPFNNACHKLVAAIIESPTVRGATR